VESGERKLLLDGLWALLRAAVSAPAVVNDGGDKGRPAAQ
jgi:hypothetical protein